MIGATVAAFAVVFAVRIVAVFGGPFERAGRVLVLAFVVAVSTSAPLSQAGTRVAAWLGAGALATLASLALWPRYEGSAILRRAAAACRALAAAARDPNRFAVQFGRPLLGARLDLSDAAAPRVDQYRCTFQGCPCGGEFRYVTLAVFRDDGRRREEYAAPSAVSLPERNDL